MTTPPRPNNLTAARGTRMTPRPRAEPAADACVCCGGPRFIPVGTACGWCAVHCTQDCETDGDYDAQGAWTFSHRGEVEARVRELVALGDLERVDYVVAFGVWP